MLNADGLELTTLGAAAFNHCSSVLPIEQGTIVTWYAGRGECLDDQSVYVAFLNNHKQQDIIRIGDKTGNPIVWTQDGKINLLFSKFEDSHIVNNLADRWKYCSLWIQQLKLIDKQLVMIGRPIRIATSDAHLLARCPPVIHQDRLLLPLYDEYTRQCVIYTHSNGEYYELSRFGKDLIQPTIWSKNNALYALARNFTNIPHNLAEVHSSASGDEWQSEGTSELYNVNNSVCAANWRNGVAVVWNDTPGYHRANLSLGFLMHRKDTLRPFKISNLSPLHGSYPTCVVHNDQLYITYTNLDRRIVYDVWTWDRVRENCRRHTATSVKRRIDPKAT